MIRMLISKATKFAACFGSAALFVSTQNVQAKEMVACHDCHMRRLPKARELPIYDKKEEFIVEYDEKSKLPLISEISILRKKVFEFASYFNIVQEQAVHVYETGVAHSKSTFDFLKNEENKVQRIVIIASGGLVGLLLARRGGFFKKTFYVSLGTGATFYAFYPSISKEYALIGWNTSKEQINNVLTKYGGYDTEKIAKEANVKIDYLKSVMKFESTMQMLRDKFYNKNTASKENEKKVEDANNNQDMYTTRSST